MRATRLATALAAFAAAQLLCAAGGAAPRGKVRVAIEADPAPVVDPKQLPAAVAALFCPADDQACAREGAPVVASAHGWVETPSVNADKLIGDCADRARIAKEFGNGVAAFQSCLWQGRQRLLWLPAAGFRVPRKGWLAFHWRTRSDCASGQDGCLTIGLVDLATGAMAVRRETAPKSERDNIRIEMLTGVAPLETARTTALLAAVAPHATRLGVAISADVPVELVTPGKSVIETPTRMAFMHDVFDGKQGHSWAWLSPTGEVWTKADQSSSAALGNLVSGDLEHLVRRLRPGCPTSRPAMDAAAIGAAFGQQDAAPFAELRAAFGQCRGARRP